MVCFKQHSIVHLNGTEGSGTHRKTIFYNEKKLLKTYQKWPVWVRIFLWQANINALCNPLFSPPIGGTCRYNFCVKCKLLGARGKYLAGSVLQNRVFQCKFWHLAKNAPVKNFLQWNKLGFHKRIVPVNVLYQLHIIARFPLYLAVYSHRRTLA